ncbi:MAG TPA: N-acetyltransferase [Candidatus Binatia bacterium]|nr:N-acetyltransferase [Candidatus Binatia bacterium]
MIRVRPERPADVAAVDAIHRAAFVRADEARIVAELRRGHVEFLSLVAELDGAVAGHVAFSAVRIDGPPAPPAAGLGPLAVRPDVQRRGIGSALVHAGLAACPGNGWRLVFVLGEPAYYSRFGFTLAAPLGLRYESEAFDRGFQVRELAPGALAGCRGLVRYADAFAVG